MSVLIQWIRQYNKVKTLTPHKQNKPDMVLWSKIEKKCFIIAISAGLDVNLKKNFNQKYDNDLPLAGKLKCYLYARNYSIRNWCNWFNYY